MSDEESNKFSEAVLAILEALEPFAAFARSEGHEDYPDGKVCTLTCGRISDFTLVLGHFRAASKAIDDLDALAP